MSGSFTKTCILGNLGADPEVRSLGNGGEVCNLRIATSESWKDRATGERKEKTEWHTVVIFVEGLVGIAKQYLKKGSKVYIEGKNTTRKWADQNGNDRYTTEVVLQGPSAILTMIDSGNSEGGARSNAGSNSNNGGPAKSNGGNNNSSNNNQGFSGGFTSDFDDASTPF